jgi:hypothetical protein
MLKKVREALDAIEDVLLVEDTAAQDLWAILSALRGPDDKQFRETKRQTTVPIRRNAFPRLAAQVSKKPSHGMRLTGGRQASFYGIGLLPLQRLGSVPWLNDEEYPHFVVHTEMALRAFEHTDPVVLTPSRPSPIEKAAARKKAPARAKKAVKR